MRRSRILLLLMSGLAGLPAVAAAAATTGHPAARDLLHQGGHVRSGNSPIPFAEVTLLQAGNRAGESPKILTRTRADRDGEFDLSYRRPKDPKAVLYVTADAAAGARRGAKPVRLAAALSPSDASDASGIPGNAATPDTPDTPDIGKAATPNPRHPADIIINERTTVATAFAMAQFLTPRGFAGTSPGLQNAAAISHNLADVTTGGVAPFLNQAPNGAQTSTLAAFNSLADILAACVRNVGSQTCGTLFTLAQPPGAPRPTNTLEAVGAIARTPAHNVSGLFALSNAKPLYTPRLQTAPDAWTLALRYVGNGHDIDGAGNIAFDADGNAWVANNYMYSADQHASVCGGRAVLKFTPTGQDAPGAPYRGGGVYGAGYGIALDTRNHVWVGNFGFQGRGCPVNPDPLFRSVSEFGPQGSVLSPPTGWRRGGIVQPQGIISDRDGNVWVANCGGRSVTEIPQGDARRAHAVVPADGTLVKPFDIAVDPQGRKWVTGNGSDNVLLMSRDGVPQRSITGGGLKRPLGIAADSLGNVWVSNTGVIPLPCEGTGMDEFADATATLPPSGAGASVTMVRADGSTPAQPSTGGGIALPWGIAVDGNDNVWVANFGGRRVAQLCGARVSACPPGVRTGQPISPATGYTFDGLVRNTGVQVDPSGNVWLCNNWQTVPFQTNPGGNELVVFVGLAAPVRTPLIGAPRVP